ncbi:MAG: hypothetical protein PVK01_02550 [Flavobacteriaceae bacterium]|jgi:hypothetical protein
MKFSFSFCLPLILILFVACSKNAPTIASFRTAVFKLSIDQKGRVNEFTDIGTGKNYLSSDSISPLLALRINKKWQFPDAAKLSNGQLEIVFSDNQTAVVEVTEKNTHIKFELISLTKNNKVDLIQWGPFRTTIQKVIGETVGVVRGETFAIGIQALNIKTLGGYPWNESDRMPAFDIFKETNIEDMHPGSDGSVLYRVEAAKPTKTGSSLQAYCRNRNNNRIVSDFNLEKIVAPAYDDGGVIGSKIALFGAPLDQALEYLGKIEIEEGLPHPMIEGEWGKISTKANAAYLITSFTEKTIDQAIELTKKAGLKYLYHYGNTFKSWGHFEINKEEFPNGIDGLKQCVEKVEKEGISLGTHCLSNFITTNDPYVTPIPDKRLAKVGRTVITASIDKTTTEIPILSPDFFDATENNNLKTVQIGEELIRYSGISQSEPWKLMDCQRGAYNTKASNHSKGQEISKLLDHAYKVFLTNADLTIEMSERLAELYNKTGMRQISFDGLEGNRSTGLGTYGESLMPFTWYSNLSPDLQKHLIIDASRTTHFFWHIYSRMNWGEPWYAGFRESQTEYRFNNQAYFQRNFMPGMLGWFQMTPETSVEDIEWMLARAAGYSAGFALVADSKNIDQNKNSNKILELIGDWEKLRISNSFSEEQKTMMRDNTLEFSIERVDSLLWDWKKVHSNVFYHEKKVKQPGEPLESNFSFQNPAQEQTLNFTLIPKNCNVSDVTLELNNYKKIKLPITIKKGQLLKYSGTDQIVLQKANGEVIKKIKMNPSDYKILTGKNFINIDCKFHAEENDVKLKVELRSVGEKSRIVLKN